MSGFKFLADINEIRYVILVLIILLLLTIFIKVIISGLNYANRKILKCESCGKRQAVWFMLKSKNPNKVIKARCVHCNKVTTFKVVDNMKNISNPSGWILKCVSMSEDVKLFGRNIFKEKWINTNEKVLVYDSSYNGEHLFCIYKVIIDDKEYRFAEGEFANGFYAFYVYNPHMYDK